MTTADSIKFFEGLSKMVLTPVTIRRIFLLLTRMHYSTPDNYGQLKKALEKFIWHPHKKDGTIYIAYDYEYDAQNLDERPAIFVGLDDIIFQKVAIDNAGQVTETRSGQNYVKVANTKVIIRHVSKSPDEVLAMADLSSQFFMGIRPMIRDALGRRLLEYDVLAIKSSRPFERNSTQADQHFMSDVIVAFSYNESWLTEMESHVIKTITWETCLATLQKNE